MTLARVAQTAPAYSDVDLTLLAAVGSIRRIIACSGMCVCIVRTGGRLSARADAGAIEPRLDVAALPDSSAGAFGVALSAIISALRVLGPIQCKAVAHKPFTKIGAADRTGRNRAAIWVETERHAIDGAPGNEGVNVIRCLGATVILRTVVAAAQLAALRRVDAPKPDTRSVNLQRVAVDDAGLTNKIIGQSASPKAV